MAASNELVWGLPPGRDYENTPAESSGACVTNMSWGSLPSDYDEDESAAIVCQNTSESCGGGALE